MPAKSPFASHPDKSGRRQLVRPMLEVLEDRVLPSIQPTFIKDVLPGLNGSNPQNLTVLGPTLFFTADDGQHGRELWKTDGTPEGTVLVADLILGGAGSNPSNLTTVGNTLFFSAFTARTGE